MHRRLKLTIEIDIPDLVKNEIETISITADGFISEKDGEEIPFKMDFVFKHTQSKYISTFLRELGSF